MDEDDDGKSYKGLKIYFAVVLGQNAQVKQPSWH